MSFKMPFVKLENLPEYFKCLFDNERSFRSNAKV
jgi:hypothetical protein